MSIDLTVALCAPIRPTDALLVAVEAALVDRVGVRHNKTILRCAAIAAIVGHGPFKSAYEALAPERAVLALIALPDHPGEAAPIGVLRSLGRTFAELKPRYGRIFDIIGTTAGHWILANKGAGYNHLIQEH